MIAVAHHALHHHPSLFAEFASACFLTGMLVLAIVLAARADRRQLQREGFVRTDEHVTRAFAGPWIDMGLELPAEELYAEHTGNTDYLTRGTR